MNWNDDTTIPVLTERGRAADSTDGRLDFEDLLIIEIIKHAGGLTQGEVSDLFDELIELCGSAEVALMAIKTCEVEIFQT
jgi:hypothetical protein